VTHPDVIVVGAGMVGAWTALGLAERGLRVLVVERAFAGAGSTGAAMGHLVVMDDTPAQLKELGQLKSQGVLTEAEFAQQKSRILGT
jgi:glycine/D-amino acid oxidase-like deaminating enzyme